MNFAIIAAGEGSRLQQEGATLPKPLTLLQGKPMIDRLIELFMRCDAERIVIIINSESVELKEHLDLLAVHYPLQLVVQTTPSSMHSFSVISPYLRGGKFCLTTVDTIFDEEEFSHYITNFATTKADGLFAVTDYIDDEKPLYVSTDATNRVCSFNDSANEGDKFISGGVYCLNDKALDVLDKCIAEGRSRMRNYQRALIEDGLFIQAYPFSKIIDVDHIEDIVKAEQFLNKKTARK